MRRQVGMQIFLPLTVGVLLIVATALGLVWAGTGSVSVWADVALVYLTLLAMVGMLVLLVVIAALAFGVGRLISWLPGRAFQGQLLVERAGRTVRRVADVGVTPLLFLHSLRAAGRAVIDIAASVWRGK